MNVIIGLLLRHALAVIGGALAVHSGTMDAQTIVGALTAIGSVVWSIVQKHNAGLLGGDNPFNQK